MRRHLLLGALLLGLGSGVIATPVAHAQDLASFEKRTTVKTLANGLTVIIVERPEAPVFSYFTHVDVGGAQAVSYTHLDVYKRQEPRLVPAASNITNGVAVLRSEAAVHHAKTSRVALAGR